MKSLRVFFYTMTHLNKVKRTCSCITCTTNSVGFHFVEFSMLKIGYRQARSASSYRKIANPCSV